MSALPDDLLSPRREADVRALFSTPQEREAFAALKAGTRLVFPPAVAMRAAGSLVLPAYGDGDRRLPYPADLRHVLRRDDPAEHWAGIVSGLLNAKRAYRYDAPEREAFAAFRAILARPGGLVSADLFPVVLALVPLMGCDHCGAPILAHSARIRHCCDRHRRRAAMGGPTSAGWMRRARERAATDVG